MKEKPIEEEDQKSVCQVLSFIPKMFKNKKLSKFLFYIFILRCWTPFWLEALTLQYVNLGYSKTNLVNLKTILMPFSMILSCLSTKYLKKGKLVYNFHMLRMLLACLFVGDYITFKYFQVTRNQAVTQKLLIFVNILALAWAPEFNFIFSFINDIVDESLGSTSITAMMVVWNSANSIPNTIGNFFYFFKKIFKFFFLKGLSL